MHFGQIERENARRVTRITSERSVGLLKVSQRADRNKQDLT
jgi:hypothetical protein